VAEVVVRYFAAAAEAAGREEETLAASTVGELHEELGRRYGPAMVRVLERGSVLADGVVTRDRSVRLAQRVDVLPPFAGG
jgi:molybdopterin converting factor small subunit